MSSLDQTENICCVHTILLKTPVLPLTSQTLGFTDLAVGAQSYSVFKFHVH